MGKLDPVGEGVEESGSIVGVWSGQLLWEAYVPAVWYGVKVEHDLAKTQSSWSELIIKKENICLYVYKVLLRCMMTSGRSALYN